MISYFLRIFVLFLLPMSSFPIAMQRPLQRFGAKMPTILHLTFSQGYADEFQKVARSNGYAVTTWHIPSLPPRFLDGVSSGNALYNITHERALNIWNQHQHTFESFDLVCVSDGAPLLRVFLQNGFTRPLLAWICGPFDYSDQASLDGPFPDPEYYALMYSALQMSNVTLIASSPFSRNDAANKGLEIQNLIGPSSPNTIQRFTKEKELFYVPPGHNEVQFMDLATHLRSLALPIWSNPTQGPTDLAGYKGIIHLPNSYSTPALFEHLALGIIYFIPSPSFFTTLAQMHNYFHDQPAFLLEKRRFDLSEWYAPERSDVFVYFDSWEDLQQKATTLDYVAQKKRIAAYMASYQKEMKARWTALFQSIFPKGST